MNCVRFISILFTLTLLAACSDTEQKVSKEEAANFSTSLENDVKNLKIDFLEKNIIPAAFLKRLYEAGDLKPSSRMEAEMKKMIGTNQN